MIGAGGIRLVTEAAAERLFSNVEVQGDCWVWTKALTKDGYGRVWVLGRVWRVHRLVFQVLHRRLRADEILDHQCKLRACCNPDHMDVVDMLTNTQRGWSPKKVVCLNGHALTEANVYRQPSTGRRRCRQCERERRVAA